MGAGVPHGTATKAYPASSDKAGHAYTNNGPGDHPSKRPGTISPNWMQRQLGETGLEPEPPGAKRTRDGQIGRGNAAHAVRGGRATPLRVTLDATRPLASPPPTRGANEGSPYIAPLGSQRRMDANAQHRPGRCNHLLAARSVMLQALDRGGCLAWGGEWPPGRSGVWNAQWAVPGAWNTRRAVPGVWTTRWEGEWVVWSTQDLGRCWITAQPVRSLWRGLRHRRPTAWFTA